MLYRIKDSGKAHAIKYDDSYADLADIKITVTGSDVKAGGTLKAQASLSEKRACRRGIQCSVASRRKACTGRLCGKQVIYKRSTVKVSTWMRYATRHKARSFTSV